MSRVLVATDLDRTIIYSRAAAGISAGQPEQLVAVEQLDGRPFSFMTAAAAGLLVELSQRHLVVPVTTRTHEQFARVRLPGPPSRYAVAANGGVLLVDGRPDDSWARMVRTAVRAVAPLDSAVAALSASCAPGWAAAPRVAAELFCYTVVDRALMPAEVVDRLREWAAPAGWIPSLQGRKLYLLPGPLSKSEAVAEIARRAGTEITLAAGDSLLDIDLLAAADAAVRPGHGEIAESGWSAPSVHALPTTGIVAGEEILAWLSAHAAEAGSPMITGPAASRPAR